MKRIIILTALTLISITNLVAQTKNDEARAYYIEAEKDYELKDYQSSLNNLNKVEEILGATNARILALKIKTFYDAKDYTNAKKFLNQFSNYDSSEALKNEILSYIVKIDTKLEEAELEEERNQLARANEQKKKIRKEKERNAEKLRVEQLINQKLLDLKSSNYDWSKNHNLAVIKDFYYYGVINNNGKLIVPFKYNDIVINEFIAYVENDERKFKLINTSTGLLSKAEYDELFFFGDNILVLENSKNVKIINCNLNNKVVFEANKYDKRNYGITGVEVDRNFDLLYIGGRPDGPLYTNVAVLNKTGEFLVPIGRYNKISKFQNNGLAEVGKNDKYGLIDLNAREILSPTYAIIYSFQGEKLALVQNFSNRYGYINEKGEEVIPAIYLDARSFENGTAVVMKKRKYFRIDENGKKVKK